MQLTSGFCKAHIFSFLYILSATNPLAGAFVWQNLDWGKKKDTRPDPTALQYPRQRAHVVASDTAAALGSLTGCRELPPGFLGCNQDYFCCLSSGESRSLGTLPLLAGFDPRLPASVSWRGRSSWERCWKKAEKLGGVHERAPEMSFQSTMMISFLLDHFWPLKGIFCTAWFCSCHGQVYACSCFAEMSQKKINVCSACRSPRLSFTGWALETQPLGMWIQNVLEKITEREAVEGLFN